MNRKPNPWVTAATVGLVAMSTLAGNAATGPSQTTELQYITDCSYSQYCTNNAGISLTSDAYGVLNDVRINNGGGGPDYVRPGTACEAMIGYMAHGGNSGVISAFFNNWALKGQEQASDGGIYSTISYTSAGAFHSASSENQGCTGQWLSAMYHYGKGNSAFLNNATAWSMVQKGANYLTKNFDASTSMQNSHWTIDTVYARCGLLCAVAWAQAVNAPTSTYSNWQSVAAAEVTGINNMWDPKWTLFFTHMQGGRPTYGTVDQTTFAPFEYGAIPYDSRAAQISDTWTYGKNGSPLMTPYNDVTSNVSAWQYFGTLLQSSNTNLSPGAGFQLASVENHAGLSTRANLRYQWADSTGYSSLAFAATGQTESGVGNGFVDWRDATKYTNQAATWQRFCDTSAYYLGDTLNTP